MSSSTLQPQAENKAGPSSIGTELEFFVAVRIDDGSQPTVPKQFASSKGNSVVIPEAGSRGRALETYAIEHVRHTITLALEKKLRGPYMSWTVEREGTASMPQDNLGQPGVSDYTNRLYSVLAHGSTGLDANRDPEAPETELESPDRRGEDSDPQQEAKVQGSTKFKTVFARGMLTGYDPGAAPGLSERMETRRERPAYDFGAYADSRYMREAPRRRQQPKRTIEFRQAAGTMDPDEVVAHAKVVVRLCEWASTAGLAEFWKLILDCEAGESTPSWFDVFDLLAKLDLNAEAKVLQRSMAPRYGIEILDEDAGTAKYPETLDPKAWDWDRRTII
ncbi:hypothetical protein DL768_010440 [Monosporascus sp. mg162]|nr:hypothetical protein DL768_010440 [Monosporascus sp. mg162]